MPKIYKRNCDFCGHPYEGYGKRFCGEECSQMWAKGDLPPGNEGPTSETREMQIAGDVGFVKVAGKERLETPRELFDGLELDDSWEMCDGKAKQYEGFMKDEKTQSPVVVPLKAVAVRFRKKVDTSFDVAPNVIEISRPTHPDSQPSEYVSVHYSDEHIPFHDPRALNIVLQVIEMTKPRVIAHHGDGADCAEISDYEKDPDNRIGLNEELAMLAEWHGMVTEASPHAERRLELIGNHEDRIRRQVWAMAEDRKGGAILKLPAVRDALRLPNILGIEDIGWEFFPYTGEGNHHILHDRLLLKHGDSVRKHSGYSARSEYEKYKKSGMSGHTHRVGSYSTRDYNGQHAWWEIGMLGDIRPAYVDFPDWQQGFAVTTWGPDLHRFHVEPVRIHEGVAFFRGKRLEGDATCFGQSDLTHPSAA